MSRPLIQVRELHHTYLRGTPMETVSLRGVNPPSSGTIRCLQPACRVSSHEGLRPRAKQTKSQAMFSSSPDSDPSSFR